MMRTLTIITVAAATLSLLAFLAVLRLPKAVMNVVQQVHAERTAERQQAVADECIYRDYLGYMNVTALITTPMEVGTAKEQTLASVRKLVGGTHLDYYYANIRRAINFAATAQYALREKRPDELCVSAWNKDPVFGVIGVPFWMPIQGPDPTPIDRHLSHIELGEFLRSGKGPEQQALLRLIGALVEVPPYA